MKYFFVIITLFCTILNSDAQTLDKYWIQFKDKTGTPYSINRPQEFLSPRAIERRQQQGIPIIENDLPVTPSYLRRIKMYGGKIYTTSKWFNAATVYADEETLAKIRRLPFIRVIEPTGRFRKKRLNFRRKKNRETLTDYKKLDNYYGFGENQIKMLNGHVLHELGFRGKDMLVAVLDGGFINSDYTPFLDSTRGNGRLLLSRDFVENDRYAYEASAHGAQVLSTMAANLPYLFVGTAPDATYVCLRTEEVGSELRIEEDNWIAGAEFADSLGADVINSSLGYSYFDKASMRYTYENMDGNFSRISRGADLAASKGILVLNSAGNEGDKKWRYIGAPADADSVFSIGGVDRYRNKSPFSSYGPTRDGRIKPNVAARGSRTIVANIYRNEYKIDQIDGTSFATPVMAGMCAALWQAFPDKNNMQIMRAIEMSGDKANNPDNALGYGIPDMYKAFLILSGDKNITKSTLEGYPHIVPNPFKNNFHLIMKGVFTGEISISVKDIMGNIISDTNHKQIKEQFNRYTIEVLDDAPSGSYIVEVTAGDKTFQLKLLKV